MLDERVDEFLALIEKIDDENVDTPNTVIREQLRNQVQLQKKKQKQIELSEQENEDRLLKLEFEHLKEVEVDGTLCWMDYQSWRYYFNKKKFIEIMHPVLWNGVFFAVEDLLLHYEALFLKENTDSAFIFGKGPFYYQIFGFGLVPNKDPIDYLNRVQYGIKKEFFENFTPLRETSYVRNNVYDQIHEEYYYVLLELKNLYQIL